MPIARLLSLGKRIHSDSLYRNSIYLIMGQLVLAVLGFFFWVVTARLYSPTDVGIATTLISITGFIASLAMLGFNQAIIRYFTGEENKASFLNTAYIISALGAISITTIFLLGIERFSPPLIFLRDNLGLTLFIIAFMIVATLNSLTDNVFIALRNAKYIFIANCFVGVTKLLLPSFFVILGALGIFYAYAISVIVGAVLSFAFLWAIFGLKLFFSLRGEVLNRVWKFTVGNYVAGMFSIINQTLVPILITNTLGPSVTAFYYMPSMIMTLLVAIPRSTASSMFAEGSYDSQSVMKLFTRTLKATYLLVVPAALVNILFGQYILLAFGKSYSSEGIFYLRCVIISLLISLPNYLFGTIFNIEQRIKLQLKFGVFGAILGITLTVVFLRYGLNGLGLSSILNQTIMLIVSTLVFLKTRNEKGSV